MTAAEYFKSAAIARLLYEKYLAQGHLSIAEYFRVEAVTFIAYGLVELARRSAKKEDLT